MGAPHFVTSDAFAGAASISVQAARKALARALDGKPWNGYVLDVRTIRARGGAAGLCYEVAVASLPPELAAKLAPAAAPCFRMPSGPSWRLDLIRPIQAAGAPGSDARAAQLRAVAARAFYPSGERAGQPIAERTLRAWLAAAEGGKVLKLAGAIRRADRGGSRVIAWREWDRAMTAAGVPEAKQRDIARTLDGMVRGLWAGGETSAANIQFNLVHRCQALAEEAGVRLGEAEMLKLCRMPLHFAGHKERRRARMAHIKKHDAARLASRHTPRVRRHREGLRPMELVAGDVRTSDILYARPDGSLATAKTVAFMDLATNRLFARSFLLPKGEMIRREHVLVTLRDMAADPFWGVWQGQYLDNGGEFSLGASPEDLAHLAHLVRTVHGDDAGTVCGNITSRPYNPQSKLIEGAFSTLTRSVEPVYPGFIGGNRMAKKTQNQGKAPVPMVGDEAAILARYAEMVAWYNAKPQQKGHIKGKSPNDAFRAFVEDAAQPWGAILLDPAEFSLSFGPDEFRTVQPGGELHIRNRVMTHPDLAPMVGEKVRVRLPILDPTRAVLLTDKGEPVLVAREAEAFRIRDVGGVRSHDRNRRAANAAMAKTAEGAIRMDPATTRAAALKHLPKMPAPAPFATVSVNLVLREEAEAAPAAALPARQEAERSRAKAEKEAAQRAVAEAWLRHAG